MQVGTVKIRESSGRSHQTDELCDNKMIDFPSKVEIIISVCWSRTPAKKKVFFFLSFFLVLDESGKGQIFSKD